MDGLLSELTGLLEELDGWFASCCRKLPAEAVACRPGCSACCRGLFDISLPEALLLSRAFLQLPETIRDRVRGKAEARLAELKQRWPHWQPPYLLNGLPDAEWTEMPEEDATPCPLLGEDGRCLVYSARPSSCRLHGLPAIDLDGSDFSSALCTRNGLPEGVDLRFPLRDLFLRENELFRRFSEKLTGSVYHELDTFIPLAVLVDYDKIDWQGDLLADPRSVEP